MYTFQLFIAAADVFASASMLFTSADEVIDFTTKVNTCCCIVLMFVVRCMLLSLEDMTCRRQWFTCSAEVIVSATETITFNAQIIIPVAEVFTLAAEVFALGCEVFVCYEIKNRFKARRVICCAL